MSEKEKKGNVTNSTWDNDGKLAEILSKEATEKMLEMQELQQLMKEMPQVTEVLYAGIKIGAMMGYNAKASGITLRHLIEALEQVYPTPEGEG